MFEVSIFTVLILFEFYLLYFFLFDTAKIRIYFYCAIKIITFLLFDVVKLFLIEKISKKQKKHKENTNITQTYIPLILKPLRTFAVE